MTASTRRLIVRLRNRFDFGIAIGLVLLGLAALMWAVPRAHATDWLLLRKLPGRQWEQRGPVLDQQVACETALASDKWVVPAGTRLKCAAVKEERR